MPRGRKQATGRYDTREELEHWVRTWYRVSAMNQAQLARACGVSATTVANILKKKEIEHK